MAHGLAPLPGRSSPPADAGHVEDAAAEIPYTRHSVSAADEAAVLRALRSGRLAQGPEVAAFEAEIAALAGAEAGVAVTSGTTALELALAALDVRPGDEVIVPTLTFVATANAVFARGAVPVFADVEPDTLNLSPRSVSLHKTRRTRGAIAVHYAGHAADVEAIRSALPAGSFVLEDAAHALGATSQGRPVGSLGDLATFSFHPAKLITCGEGGAIIGSDATVMDAARRARDHGLIRSSNKTEGTEGNAGHDGLGLPDALAEEEQGAWVYELQEPGTNARLPEISAALGRSQLASVDERLQERRRLAARYAEALADRPELRLPVERPGESSAWHLYPIRLTGESPARRRVYESLKRQGIGAQIHYIPVHLQPAYRRRLRSAWGDLPVAEDAYLRLLSLPLFPGLRDDEQDRIVAALDRALGEEAAR